MTAKWKKLSKKNRKKIDGIEIQYSTSSDFSNAVTKKIKKTATSKRIKKLSKKTRYYVRVRTYKGSSHGPWSTVKSGKTK